MEVGMDAVAAGLWGAVIGACLGAVGVGLVYELTVRPTDRRTFERTIRHYEGALRRAYESERPVEEVTPCLH